MTPEERAAEKKRLQLLQEEADTKMGLDTLGLTAFAADSANPTSKEDLEEFAKVISRHVSQHKDNPEYVPFVEELVKKLCAGCEFFFLKGFEGVSDGGVYKLRHEV